MKTISCSLFLLWLSVSDQLPENLQLVVDYHNVNAKTQLNVAVRNKKTAETELAAAKRRKDAKKIAELEARIEATRQLIAGLKDGSHIVYPSLRLPPQRNDVGWLLLDRVKVKRVLSDKVALVEIAGVRFHKPSRSDRTAVALIAIETEGAGKLEEELTITTGIQPYITTEGEVDGVRYLMLRRFKDANRLKPFIKPVK
jgi:hypothetical protein